MTVFSLKLFKKSPFFVALIFIELTFCFLLLNILTDFDDSVRYAEKSASNVFGNDTIYAQRVSHDYFSRVTPEEWQEIRSSLKGVRSVYIPASVGFVTADGNLTATTVSKDFIDAYSPILKSGKWIKESKSDKIPIVVSGDTFKLHNVIKAKFFGEERIYELEIVGILADFCPIFDFGSGNTVPTTDTVFTTPARMAKYGETTVYIPEDAIPHSESAGYQNRLIFMEENAEAADVAYNFAFLKDRFIPVDFVMLRENTKLEGAAAFVKPFVIVSAIMVIISIAALVLINIQKTLKENAVLSMCGMRRRTYVLWHVINISVYTIASLAAMLIAYALLFDAMLARGLYLKFDAGNFLCTAGIFVIIEGLTAVIAYAYSGKNSVKTYREEDYD